MFRLPRSLWIRAGLALAVLSLTTGFILAIATWLYYRDVARDVERAFATYRWKVPSRIYSDRQALFVGLNLGLQGVAARLERTGYRATKSPPQRPGEFRLTSHQLDLYQRALHHPTLGHDARKLRFTLAHGTIVRIESDDSTEAQPLVYLEPELLGVLVGDTWQDRELVHSDDMPAAVTQAVVAIEDRRFYTHPGVDLRGIARALWQDVRQRRLAQGGSTLTQQLVKNIILRDASKTLARKYPEMVMAYAIDREYSKQEILTKYLNEIYYGQSGAIEVRGIGSAARHYFGKPVDELTLGEAATLAGIIHGPNQYVRKGAVVEKRLTTRRNQVLDAMYQVGYITETDLRAAKIAPLAIRTAPASRKLAPYFVDLLRRQLQREYSLEGLTQEGLAVYTTLQMPVQLLAEQSVTRRLAMLEQQYPRLRRSDPLQQLQAAVVVLRPSTGEILALVGGRDYAATQYDRIHRAMRQPGSLLKPFIYLAAIESRDEGQFAGGFGPLYALEDTTTTFRYRGTEYTPSNYDRRTYGWVPAYDALARSLNIPAVALFERLGTPAVEHLLRRFGVTTPLADYLPAALGASEVYPIEMARAYGALAADGMLAQPRVLSNVIDATGSLLQHPPFQLDQAASPGDVAILNAMLRQTVERGTARAVRTAGISIPLAAKTGTTSDGKDTWFVGYGPELLILTWVGFDDGTPMRLTGSQAAVPLWVDIMKGLDLSGEEFPIPEGVEELALDLRGGGVAGEQCLPGERLYLVFRLGHAPPACRLHPSGEVPPVETHLSPVSERQ